MVDQMQQSAGCSEFLLSLRTAELVRRDRAHEAMYLGVGIVLTENLQSHLEGHLLSGEPTQLPPDGHVVECSLINLGRARRSLITDDATARTRGLAIRLVVVLKVTASQFQQRLCVVTLVGEYESRGNR